MSIPEDPTEAYEAGLKDGAGVYSDSMSTAAWKQVVALERIATALEVIAEVAADRNPEALQKYIGYCQDAFKEARDNG